MRARISRVLAASTALLLVAAAACGDGGDAGGTATGSPAEGGSITVYSGRSESLVGPLLEQFESSSGIKVNVRYGDTAELAGTIQEEGANSPADVFFGQDAGALGQLQSEGLFADLPESILSRVPETFRSREGKWVGTSGRVRVIAYNPTLVKKAGLPESVEGLTDAKWKGKVGWAPTNGSFQIFVTAFRKLKGQDAAKRWLERMKANDTQVYPKNDAIVEAIHEGEIHAGLVNHYYPFQLRAEVPDAKVEDHFLANGDPGGLINVAGAGILASSKRRDQATRFVEYLLSDAGQKYFVVKTFEYPVVEGIDQDSRLPALETLEPPTLDLSQLADLKGTLELLQQVGLL